MLQSTDFADYTEFKTRVKAMAKSAGFNSPSRFSSAGLRLNRIYRTLIRRGLPRGSSLVKQQKENDRKAQDGKGGNDCGLQNADLISAKGFRDSGI